MTPDQMLTLYITLIPTVGVVLAAVITSSLALLQSRANKTAIAENTALSKVIQVSIDGRMDGLLKTTDALATAIERLAGDKRTVAAVAEEREAGEARAVVVAESAKPGA